jgi:uncharacterized protein YegJ (DUF2314 family)
LKIILLALAVLGALYLLWRSRQPPAGMVFALDDPRAENAKRQARDTLPEFWAALEAGVPTDSEFGLKFDLNHGTGLPDRELIWALDISRVDGVIRGRLGNPPINPAFREGDSVTIAPEAIADWAFFRSNVAHGHHLTRLMIELSPPRDAAQARKALGWD